MERITLYEALIGSGFFLWFVKYLVAKIIETYMQQKQEIERLKESWVSEKIESLEKTIASHQSSLDLHKQKMIDIEVEFKTAKSEMYQTREKRDSLMHTLEEYIKNINKRMEALEKSTIVKQGDVYILKRGNS